MNSLFMKSCFHELTQNTEHNPPFQNPLSCNRKRHHTLCSNSTGDYVVRFSSGLATDRVGSDPGSMSGGFMSARPKHCVVLALDLEGVHDVKLHHPSSSVATSNQ